MDFKNGWVKNLHFISWVCFILFALVLGFLSYGSLPDFLEITLVLLGLGLPWGILLGGGARRIGKTSRRKDSLSFPPFLLGSLALLALGLRFWDLQGFFLWPIQDEAINGLRALQLAHHWEWRLFYYGQAPPPLVWSTALLLKVFHTPLLCLWIPPAVISSATLVAAVASARAWGFKTQGWIFGALWGFTYFPLWLGRVCLMGVLLPAWECLGFCWLGLYAKAEGDSKTYWAAILGFWIGLGYLAFSSFLVVSLFLAVLFIHLCWGRKKGRVDLSWFLVCGFVSFCPFIWEWANGNVGGHIQSVAFWNGTGGAGGLFRTWGDYIRLLFWGGPGQGLFNPLLVALALVGLAVHYRIRKIYLLGWSLALVLWMAPGFFSMNMEVFRVVQMAPMVLWAAATGLESLLEAVPPTRKIHVFLLVISAIGIMDFRQLRSLSQDISKNPERFIAQGKSIERYRAYVLLKETYDRQGPGFIFPDFEPDNSFDFSLRFATTFFNAVDQPQLAAKAQWAAVMTNLDYQPFLESQFPGARWYNLDFDRPQGGQAALALLPLTTANRATVENWSKGSVCFRDIEKAVMDSQENQAPDKTLEEALQHSPQLKDRLLVSCFWERMADFFYNYMGHPYEKNLSALRMSVTGYPAAHLYYELGCLLLRGGHLKEAQEAFKKVRQAPLNFCPVDSALKLVEQRENLR